MFVDPWGQVVAKCQDKEDALVYEIDMEYLEDVRKRLPCIDHVRLDMFSPPE